MHELFESGQLAMALSKGWCILLAAAPLNWLLRMSSASKLHRVWLAGSAAILIHVVVQQIFAYRRLVRFARLDDPGELQVCRKVSQRLSILLPKLLVQDSAMTPFVFGVWQSKIVLPAASRTCHQTRAIGMSGKLDLVRRIESLLDSERNRTAFGQRSLRYISLFLVVLCLGVAIVQLRSVADEPPKGANQGQTALKAAATAESPIDEGALSPGDKVVYETDLPKNSVFRIGSSVFRPGRFATDLAISPDGKFAASMGGGALHSWDATTGKLLWSVDTYDLGIRGTGYSFGGKAVDFAADSNSFYTTGKLNAFVKWDVVSGKATIIQVENGFSHDVPVKYEETPEARMNGLPTKTPKAIDISADGQRVLLSSSLGVLLCDVNGRVLKAFANRPEKIIYGEGPQFADRLTYDGHYCDGRFSPDGSLISLMKSESPTAIQIVSTTDFDTVATIALNAWTVRQAFSPDGSSLAITGSDGVVRTFNVKTGQEIWSHQIELKNLFENYAAALAYSPDGDTLAVGATDDAVYFLASDSGQLETRIEPHDWSTFALAYSPNFPIIYTAGAVIHRWSVPSVDPIDLTGEYHATGVAAASPTTSLVAFGDARKFTRIIDSNTGNELGRIGADAGVLKFSTDGKLLAAGGQEDGQIWVGVWSSDSFERLHFWQWPQGPDLYATIKGIDFRADKRRLAATSFRQDLVFLWDLDSGKQLAACAHKNAYGLSFNATLPVLVSGGWDEYLRFWDSNTGEAVHAINVRAAIEAKEHERQNIYHVSCSPDGRYVAAGHGLDISLFDMQSYELRNRFQYHRSGGWGDGDMNFSPDGLWLSSADMSGILKIWDPFTGQRVTEVGTHSSNLSEFCNGGGQLLSAGGDGYCYLWNTIPESSNRVMNPAELWNDLTCADSTKAYLAYWELVMLGDQAVEAIAKNLREIGDVFDVHTLTRGMGDQQARRRVALLEQLLAKDDKAIELDGVRRATRLLSQIGTPTALRTLKELSNSADSELLREEALRAMQISREE